MKAVTGTLVRWLVLASLIVAPAVALLALVDQDAESGVVDPPAVETILIDPVTTEVSGSLPVQLEVLWTDPLPLVAGGANGTTTGVFVHPGDTISHLDPIYAVDSVKVVAVHTSQPFHRPLKYRDRGDDVVRLREVLHSAGILDEVANGDDDLFDTELRTATRAFESLLGVAEPTGVFEPSMTVWLPEKNFLVHEVLVSAGTPGPSLGQAIVSSAPVISDLVARDLTGYIVELEPGYMIDVTDYGLSFRVDSSLNKSLAAAVSESLVDRTALPTALDATLRPSQTSSLLSVPSSAVLTDADGSLCVFVVIDGEPHSRTVDVESSRPGVSLVSSGIAQDERVVANPAASLGLVACH
jgi:hypothetical protein